MPDGWLIPHRRGICRGHGRRVQLRPRDGAPQEQEPHHQGRRRHRRPGRDRQARSACPRTPRQRQTEDRPGVSGPAEAEGRRGHCQPEDVRRGLQPGEDAARTAHGRAHRQHPSQRRHPGSSGRDQEPAPAPAGPYRGRRGHPRRRGLIGEPDPPPQHDCRRQPQRHCCSRAPRHPHPQPHRERPCRRRPQCGIPVVQHVRWRPVRRVLRHQGCPHQHRGSRDRSAAHAGLAGAGHHADGPGRRARCSGCPVARGRVRSDQGRHVGYWGRVQSRVRPCGEECPDCGELHPQGGVRAALPREGAAGRQGCRGQRRRSPRQGRPGHPGRAAEPEEHRPGCRRRQPARGRVRRVRRT